MESVTKTKVTQSQILTMVKNAFGEEIQVVATMELTEGYFNTGYLIELSNRLKTVLKIGPSPEVTVMRYEKDIMDMEVHTLSLIQSLQAVPTPKVLFYDNKKEIISSNYFFMEFMPGEPLYSIKQKLNEAQKEQVSAQLGAYVKRFGTIKADRFGYILQPDRSYTTWSECFLSMIDEILEDAKDQNVQLPYSTDKIREIFHQYKTILEEVTAASLVHKDLWEGNILIDAEAGKITGIIDCERALFGDPIMEIDCGLLRGNTSFLGAFLGRENLSESEYVRSNMYNVYLYLLIVSEIPFRKYPDPRMEEWARNQLDRAFEALLHGHNGASFTFNL